VGLVNVHCVLQCLTKKKDFVISMFCPIGFSSILEYQKNWKFFCGQVVPLETKVIGHNMVIT
jgi:hypothetical protein